MTDAIVEITRCEEFSAAHRLHDPRLSDEDNRRLYGPCNTDHGHNYILEVTVRGPVPASGMVMELNVLMLILSEKVLVEVDHKHMNRDVPFLQGVIPTAENVAVAFWKRIESELRPYAACSLRRVRIWESRGNYVEYHGERA